MVKKLIERLNELQVRSPWTPLLFGVLITIFFGFCASRLELRTQYDALLPESEASVQELHRVQERTASAQTVLILLEGPDHLALRAMGDAIVPKLLALGPETIGSAEDGIQDARAFLAPRAGLFLEPKELLQLRDDVNARWDYEVAKEEGILLDDTGPPVTVDDIEKRFRKKTGGSGTGDKGGKDDKADQGDKDKTEERYPDGYYEKKDGTALVIQARSPIPGGDLAKTGPALQAVREAVASVQASRPEFAAIRVGYAGDMPQGFIEYDRIQKDLLSVGATGIGLILGAVLLYFMRLRALFVMGVTIAVALVWTLGLTQLVIGHLNVATGFLPSIIAGNGVNVGILYQSRYFEERRGGLGVVDSLRTSVFATWQPTVIAALASAASYVSLLSTNFGTFRQFGFIAASGMLFCWVVKTLMVPPLLLVLERRRPIDDSKDGPLLSRIRRFGMGYGRIFAWIVPKAPVLLIAIGVVVVVSGSVAAVSYVRRDPMEYDMGKLGNDPSHDAEIDRVWSRVFEVMGSGPGGVVVLADTPEDARSLEKKLKTDWDAAPEGQKPFAAVHTLWSMVADDQAEKNPGPARDRRSPRARTRQGLHQRRRLEEDQGWDTSARPAAVRHRRSPGKPRPALLREGRHPRPARRDRVRARQVRRPSLPDPLLELVPRDPPAQRKDRAGLGPRRDLRRRLAGRGARHPAGSVSFAGPDHPDGPGDVPARGLARAERAVCSPRGRGGRDAVSLLRRREDQLPQLLGASHHVRYRGGLRRERRAEVPRRRKPRHPGRSTDHGRRRGALQPHDDARVPRACRLTQPRHPQPGRNCRRGGGQLPACGGAGIAGAVAARGATSSEGASCRSSVK